MLKCKFFVRKNLTFYKREVNYSVVQYYCEPELKKLGL